MIKIVYPNHAYRIRRENDKEWIFDEVRKKWVRLTPEEWVRQNMIQYLIQVQQVSLSLIAVEKEIQLGELSRRFDLLVFDASSQPQLLIECKAQDVPLSEAVLEQVLRYHLVVQVPYIIITNGNIVCAFEKKEDSFVLMNNFPLL